MPFPTTGVLDNFDRANAGPPPSASWTNINGDGWKVVSNRCQTQTTSAGWSNSYWNVASYQNCEVYCTIITKPATGGVIHIGARWNIASDLGYLLRIASAAGTDTISLVYYDGATDNLLASWSQEISTGDAIGLEISGSDLTAYYKASGGSWTALGSVVDSNVTGSDRLVLYADNPSAVIIDDFSGGEIIPDSSLSDASMCLVGVS